MELEELEEKVEEDNDHLPSICSSMTIGGRTNIHKLSAKSDAVTNDISDNDEGENTQNEEGCVSKRQRILPHSFATPSA